MDGRRWDEVSIFQMSFVGSAMIMEYVSYRTINDFSFLVRRLNVNVAIDKSELSSFDLL